MSLDFPGIFDFPCIFDVAFPGIFDFPIVDFPGAAFWVPVHCSRTQQAAAAYRAPCRLLSAPSVLQHPVSRAGDSPAEEAPAAKGRKRGAAAQSGRAGKRKKGSAGTATAPTQVRPDLNDAFY